MISLAEKAAGIEARCAAGITRAGQRRNEILGWGMPESREEKPLWEFKVGKISVCLSFRPMAAPKKKDTSDMICCDPVCCGPFGFLMPTNRRRW